ncbi:MAG TPA: hypothetical protein VFB88_18925 [Xanthobacteraceae bacterium]|nr:hypothetical protein [Xanthobacteraceae bacterium]
MSDEDRIAAPREENTTRQGARRLRLEQPHARSRTQASGRNLNIA